MGADLLAKSFASTRGVLAAVTPEQLEGSSTPCAAWSVKELVQHIVGGATFFALVAETGTPPGEGAVPEIGPDPLAAFDVGSARAVRAFEAEGTAERIMHLPFGELPGSVFVNIASVDTFAHGWDLAKATGQSTDLAPEVATELLAISTAFLPDSLRGPEGEANFGPRVEAAADACPADQLAAFLGRRP